MLCSPSTDCAQGQTSAGVAIFARRTVGLRWPDGLARGAAVPYRLLSTMVDLPGWPPLLVGSAYLYTGEGLSQRNLHILKMAEQVMEGAHLALLGADWNFGSACLEMSGMPRKAGMLIVYFFQKCEVTVGYSRI
ncbi:unnamed protein product [Prorocentrum cordatum]|uniref:Uncharacterized protein n=1 Tax=Prorocentrum cordatum TaxID=2364126 RepID=A0ABN9XPI1_9DINO|nr:unnamed protein product [Polarella glacialis]